MTGAASPAAAHAPDQYISTRGNGGISTFCEVVLQGLAPDGGLYLPQRYPQLPPALLDRTAPASYRDLVTATLTPFVGQALPKTAVQTAIDQALSTFRHAAVTPLKQIDDDLWVLELFHGPTMAFKDCAMQLMAPLASSALAQTDERLVLITATSGDTGAAAVRAFANAERITLAVLHPKGRVSPVQYRQMATVDAPNVVNIAVDGDFDDCQAMVKALLADPDLRAHGLVSSVNSINWGRLAGQIPYYLYACRALGGPLRFIVPTGNFGDAFAGWVAGRMGAQIASITAAVNANDALARALNTGVYVRRKAVETASVSMDVQAPSNFERLVFEASGRDPTAVRALFDAFAATGDVTINPALQTALNGAVCAMSVSEDETNETLAHVHAASGDVICPHTSVGVAAARRLSADGPPRVVLATAHAAKFPNAITRALGFAPRRPAAIAALDDLPDRVVDIRVDLAEARRVIKSRVSETA